MFVVPAATICWYTISNFTIAVTEGSLSMTSDNQWGFKADKFTNILSAIVLNWYAYIAALNMVKPYTIYIITLDCAPLFHYKVLSVPVKWVLDSYY